LLAEGQAAGFEYLHRSGMVGADVAERHRERAEELRADVVRSRQKKGTRQLGVLLVVALAIATALTLVIAQL
jgi:hypothetical protein